MDKSVIFDMDGLMFDTERIFSDMERKIAAEWKLEGIEEIITQSYGVNSHIVRGLYLNKYGKSFNYDAFLELTLKYVRGHLEKNGIPKKLGLHEMLDFLDEIGSKKAVATSTFSYNAIPLLKTAGIFERFDVVVTGDMVKKSKPEPDIFLKAAKMIDAAPSDCIVLEDSFSGIKAAYAAGMIPIMIPDQREPTDEIIPYTYAISNNLNEAIEIIKQLKSLLKHKPALD